MAAFDRVASGIPEMDGALDNIRLGDNVVLRVSDLDSFRTFAVKFTEQAIRDHRNITYVRFADHPPLIPDYPEVKTVCIPLNNRFEQFTVTIHDLITKEGKGAFFIFDCLSELQTAWATDLMMGNFFRLTCPYLFQLDTVAWFPIIRGKHSSEAIARIRDTTQLFLDVFSGESEIYVRPLKVWNRESATMFLPHRYDPEDQTFRPIMGGVQSSRFFRAMNEQLRASADLNTDSWDRFFQSTQLLYENGADVSDACDKMCRIMLTRDLRMRKLIHENFLPQDYFDVRSRMIGTGLIGGKACGMLTARKIIERNRPDLAARLEPHDSFYIGSDVFYSYLVDNGLWGLRLKQRSAEGYFSAAGEMSDALAAGKFSHNLEEQFSRVLEYYGQDPCIVRSSSILEDGFGNAFAGKYESVFCSNSGTMEERLREFEDAIRTVYQSTMSRAALEYRKRRGLDRRDEQMSLLVQRVSGSRYEEYFLPSAAGVGYSMSPYHFDASGNATEGGMLRLVMGLGTAAVDRERGSYPRIVECSHPEKTRGTTSAERHQYSQQAIDAVNTKTGHVDSLNVPWAEKNLPEGQLRLLLSHDFDAESQFLNRGQRRKIRYVSCDGIVENKQLMDDLRDMLALIQEKYEYPVDTEFTINLTDSGEYVIDLLQCRPLQTEQEGESVVVPGVEEDNVFLESRGASMGVSREIDLDCIVIVDPVAYYNMPYAEKYSVRNAVGAVNWAFRGKGKHLMLLAPGRLGTSSPELGVPTSFADISEFDCIAEVEEQSAGYDPELSYGSHMFQDLVEENILYTAVFRSGERQYYPGRFTSYPNLLTRYYAEGEKLSDIVRVYCFDENKPKLYYDMVSGHLLVTAER